MTHDLDFGLSQDNDRHDVHDKEEQQDEEARRFHALLH